MKKSSTIVLVFLFVVLLIGSELYVASNNAMMMNSVIEKRAVDTVPELLQALAETAPRTPTDLRELILALEEVTPAASQTDYDGDGLWDIVESVIGTDPRNNDSDFDLLNDTYEAFNGLNPLNADSNSDGISDNHEVNVTAYGPELNDFDNDGTPNAWDSDNDGDGVPDNYDLSPYALSEVQSEFDLSIQTEGKPTYITFQLVPENPEHLKLYYQKWDWPDGDSEAVMQDIYGNKEDISIIPLLVITSDVFPNQTAMDEMGINRTDNHMKVLLNPVLEYEEVLAFTGKVLYLNTTPLSINFNVKLRWQVMGNSSVYPQPIPLVYYEEPFRFTGIQVESCYHTDYGVFYNGTDVEQAQTTAASFLLDGLFLHNATTSVSDTLGLLAANNIEVSSYIGYARDRYQALVNITNNVVPTILEAYQSEELLSTIIIIEAGSKVIDMSEIELTGPFCMNLSEQVIINAKSMKTNCYDISSAIGIGYTDFANIIVGWHLSEIATSNLLALLSTWMLGRSIITSVDGIPFSFDIADNDYLELARNITGGIQTGLEIPSKILTRYKQFRFATKLARAVSSLTGSSISSCFEISLSLHNIEVSFSKVLRTFDKFVKLSSIGLAFGASIFMGFVLANTIGGSIGESVGTMYAVISSIITLVGIIIGNIIGAVNPLLGAAFGFIYGISSSLGRWAERLVDWFINVGIITIDEVMNQIPDVYIAGQPDITYVDTENNGFNVGDSVEIDITVVGRVNTTSDVAYGYPPYAVTFKFEHGEGVYDYWEEYKSIYEYIGDSFVYPTIRIKPPENTGSSWTMSPAWWEYTLGWLPTWDPSGGYLGIYWISDSGEIRWDYDDHVYGDMSVNVWSYYTAHDYLFSVTPGIAMDNFPLILYINSAYKLWQIYNVGTPKYIDAMDYKLEESCASDGQIFEETLMYIDVFPGTLDEFVNWGVITALDSDCDRLFTETESDRMLHDSDSDGLNDYFEIQNGLDPQNRDMDGDGLSDFYEFVYGTDVRNPDTDQDGLDDFKEISGWIISFYYMENLSLPFEIPVTSNPHSNDTDGDGFDDFTEYKSNTNPRSNDTNADGYPDRTYPDQLSQAIYESSTDWIIPSYRTTGPVIWDITIDDEGYLYVPGHQGVPNDNITIRRYDSSLKLTTLPSSSYFNNMTIWDDPTYDEYVSAITVDNVNDWIYMSKSYATTTGIYRFNMNGTTENPDSWSPLSVQAGDLHVDKSGNIYVLVRGSIIYKYSPSGVLLGTIGSGGYDIEDFQEPLEFAIDERFGFVYVVDWEFDPMSMFPRGTRLMKFRLSDGAFLEEVLNLGSYTMINDVAVDKDGYVYVVTSTGTTQIRKFSPDGQEDLDFRFSGNGTSSFWENGPDTLFLTVGNDNSIYVLDQSTYSLDPVYYRIWKFTQIITPKSDLVGSHSDWDNDSLTNDLEVNGWEITFTNSSGAFTEHVTSNYLMKDTDLDGLNDTLEFALGSNPTSSDTDSDGVSDHEEWWISQYPGQDYIPPQMGEIYFATSVNPHPMYLAPDLMNLTHWDTDGDLLGDGIEITLGSSPLLTDSDGEGLSDFMEFLLNSSLIDIDSDGDGINDNVEYQSSTDILSPDSDGDLAFDGLEYNNGTNPLVGDSDGDALLDGYEYIYGSDPLNNDTDGDGVLDGIEAALFLNLTNPDTDGDSVPDGTELQWGSSPWHIDSDRDGVIDSLDPDTFSTWEGPVVLVYGLDAENATLEFAEKLTEFVNVIVVSIDEFLSDYSDSKYIILIGRPDSSSYNVERLIYDLLEDTGSILEDMMEPDSHELAVRHGVWSSTQTVVMISSAVPDDVYPVLQILRGRDITILPNYVLVDYDSTAIISYYDVEFAILVSSIDTVREIGSIAYVSLSEATIPSMSITRYNETTAPFILTPETGLPDGEVGLHNYIQLKMHQGQSAFVFATLIFLYKHSDIDLVRDGELEGIGDIAEASLKLYYYNEVSETWELVSLNLSWVLAMGINGTDIEVFGKAYAGYVWVDVTELPLFTMAGQVIGWSAPAPPWLLILGIVGGGFGVAVAIVGLRRWRRSRSYGKKMSLFDDLLEGS